MSNVLNLGFGCRENSCIITPETLLAQLCYEFGENLFDPCPVLPNADGLSISWKDKNYVNPPYTACKKWVIKAAKEFKAGRQSIVLVPFRPDANYWRDFVWPNATDIYIFTERITFAGYSRGLPITLCLIVFGEWEGRNKDWQLYYPCIHPYKILHNKK